MKSWWRAVVAYPPTWLAMAALVVATWLFVQVLDPPTLFLLALIAVVVVSIAAWPFVMSATGTLSKLQFEMPRVEEVDPTELAAIEADLSNLDDDRPIRQLHAATAKHANLTEVLRRRLDAGEFTYARYLATAQEVYSGALHNLHEVSVAMRSVSAIDGAYIDQRLGELDTSSSEAATIRERESLEGRRQLQTSQEQRIADLLAQNESAMTALDSTATALANAPIGRQPQDVDSAMDALEELASRADKYATG